MGVDDVGGDAADLRAQLQDGDGRDAFAFAKDVNAVWSGEALDELAAVGEAADVELVPAALERAADIDDAVFHPAGIEGENDVEHPHGREGAHGRWKGRYNIKRTAARRRKRGGSWRSR